jgi:PAS domain S-box/diguanylate cyclase (GGDEF) domain
MKNNELKNTNILSSILSSIDNGVIATDKSGIIDLLNPAAENLTGWGNEEAEGKDLNQVFNIINGQTQLKDEDIAERVLKTNMVQQSENHSLLISKDGVGRAISYSAVPIKSSENTHGGVVIIFKDISSIKRAGDEIEYLTTHDKLTGLYNRDYYDRMMEEIDRKEYLPISFIVGDINGLKFNNDIFGHEVGDRLIAEVSNILRQACRKQDIISRLGGDEFSIILPRTDEEEVMMVCKSIADICENFDNFSIKPSIALGYYSKKSMEDTTVKCIRHAEDRMFRNKMLYSQSMHSDLIKSLTETLYQRNLETEEHAVRMKNMGVIFGEKLNLTESEKDELSLLALLHDIGKVAVPDKILLKETRLTEEEFNEIKKHSEVGYRIAVTSKELYHIAEFILCHHERWDGKGYPQGLKGNEIPKLSRIISILDSYDAMTSYRVYKKPMQKEEALKEIRYNAGTQFDPELAHAFLNFMGDSAVL